MSVTRGAKFQHASITAAISLDETQDSPATQKTYNISNLGGKIRKKKEREQVKGRARGSGKERKREFLINEGCQSRGGGKQPVRSN